VAIKRRGQPRSTSIIEARAECFACDWLVESDNAVGLAAQHHKRTGHEVMSSQTIKVHYDKSYAGTDHE
jgi:hypothetical protein